MATMFGARFELEKKILREDIYDLNAMTKIEELATNRAGLTKVSKNH